MKSISEQIADKCVHFNGVMNTKCDAGVSYADVRVDKPYKFPCLKTGGVCTKVVFPTAEQVETELAELAAMAERGLRLTALIKQDLVATEKSSGEIECLCGGRVQYYVSGPRKHIHACCDQCNIRFGE